jgi:16S rRNA processing protein RimM
MAGDPAYVVVGRITRPHGIRGELRMVPDTDFPDRLASLSEAVLLKDGRPTPVRVASVRPHGTDVLIKLAGIDSITTAEVWRGAELAVPRAQAPQLPQGRHYVFEVVGLRVITEAGQEVGTVREVLRTGSNDVYIVRGGDREYLIPAISSVVLSIDPAAGRMVIRPLAGLLE